MVAGTDCGRLLADSISLVRICKETIYRFIYGKEDYGLGLYRYLPEARRKRHPRGSRKPRNSVFPASHRISQTLILLVIAPSSAIGRVTF